MAVETIKADTKKLLKEFILLPWQIYRDDKAWVPPLISEVKATLDKDKNPFWKHAEGELFLARREGRVVGRIAAIVDRLYLEKFKDRAGYFGFFECVDDIEAALSLFDTAGGWLRERGITSMKGPMNPSANDECGLLVDGFDTPPYLMMTHNPRYYVDLFEGCGLKKAMDWVAYVGHKPREIPQAAIDAVEFAKKKIPGLVIRHINVNDPEREMGKIKEIYNSAWRENWGFVPMTDEEINAMVKRLRPIAVSELILFAEVDGEPVGILALVPNYNEVLKKLNGRLFPFGIFKLLYYSRKIKSLRLILMGVKEEFRMRGVEAILYLESLKKGIELGYKEYEGSMILENNIMMRRAAETFGGKVYKTYRIYEKSV